LKKKAVNETKRSINHPKRRRRTKIEDDPALIKYCFDSKPL
jgi:hypothetical protein